MMKELEIPCMLPMRCNVVLTVAYLTPKDKCFLSSRQPPSHKRMEPYLMQLPISTCWNQLVSNRSRFIFSCGPLGCSEQKCKTSRKSPVIMLHCYNAMTVGGNQYADICVNNLIKTMFDELQLVKALPVLILQFLNYSRHPCVHSLCHYILPPPSQKDNDRN